MKIYTHPDAASNKVAWLFLDMNSYFAAVEQQLHPEWRGKPIAVVPMMSDSTCAIAASYEAKAYGIKTGTNIREAKERCPELILTTGHHDVYRHYHEKFLAAIEQHLPVTHVASIDEVACALDSRQADIDTAIALAHAIKQTMREEVGEAVTCSIGLSTNRLLAKIATDLEKPNGLVVLMPEAAPEALADKPLDFLPGIGAGMLARCYRAGISTIPQLYQLSAKHMRKIWGSVSGERYWYGLRGVELPDEPTQKRTVGHSHVLDPQWRPVDKAETIARRLTLKAASRLRRYGYDATRLTLTARLEDTYLQGGVKMKGARYGLEARFHPLCDNIALSRELGALWQELLARYPIRRVKKLSVTLHGLVPHDDPQANWLNQLGEQNSAQQQRHENLSFAMDALNARFGLDTVALGTLPRQNVSFSGTKIAFSRIPEAQEFHE